MRMPNTMLHFLLLCICYIFYMSGFGGSPADGGGRQDMHFFLKKSVMFINVYNLCSSVDRGT
jgi:hypothetical protein